MDLRRNLLCVLFFYIFYFYIAYFYFFLRKIALFNSFFFFFLYHINVFLIQFSSVQSLSRVLLFVTPWAATCQASLSIINSQSLLKLMSIESVMTSNHLILCRPLILLPSTFPASGSFLMSQLFASMAKVLEFQLQHQSFQ